MSAPKKRTRARPKARPADAAKEVADLRAALAHAQEDARAVREVLATFASLALRARAPAELTLMGLRTLAEEWCLVADKLDASKHRRMLDRFAGLALLLRPMSMDTLRALHALAEEWQP